MYKVRKRTAHTLYRLKIFLFCTLLHFECSQKCCMHKWLFFTVQEKAILFSMYFIVACIASNPNKFPLPSSILYFKFLFLEKFQLYSDGTF